VGGTPQFPLEREAAVSVCIFSPYVNNLYTNQLRRIDYGYPDSETKLLQIRLIMLQQKRRGGRSNQVYATSLNKNSDLVLPTPRLPVDKSIYLEVCF